MATNDSPTAAASVAAAMRHRHTEQEIGIFQPHVGFRAGHSSIDRVENAMQNTKGRIASMEEVSVVPSGWRLSSGGTRAQHPDAGGKGGRIAWNPRQITRALSGLIQVFAK